MEQRAASAAADLGKIDGCELLAPSVATPIALSTDRSIQQESLLALMKALDEMGMISQVQSIHLDDLTVLSMRSASPLTLKVISICGKPF